MIKLGAAYCTAQTTTYNGATTTTTTDTLFVSYVEVSFNPASIRAKILKGTLDANGNFVCNLPPIWVNVNTDGSFESSDGSWIGAAGALNVAQLMTPLTAVFDQAILATGLVTGTQE